MDDLVIIDSETHSEDDYERVMRISMNSSDEDSSGGDSFGEYEGHYRSR